MTCISIVFTDRINNCFTVKNSVHGHENNSQNSLLVAPAPVLTHSAFCVTCEQKSGLFELDELA